MLNKLLRFTGLVTIFVLSLVLVFLPMLFVKLVFGLMGCRTTITEEEVYESLSHTEWKTGLELTDEIRKVRLERQPYAAMLDSIYPALRSLERSDLVERRERQLSEERAKIRGNRPQHEFRRKPGGKRTKEEKGGWLTLPTPVPSWESA